MKAKIISVTFEATAQNYRNGRLTIPKSICELMELNTEDGVIVQIKGQRINSKLKSGTEIYGKEISDLLQAGEIVNVTISLEE
jgi:bifunctional DNA-binding transcriptional regulator/antitoxin component of YhaV-PrlF toxin-antitoxin module